MSCDHEDVRLDTDEDGHWAVICELCFRKAILIHPIKWYQTKESREWDAK